MKDLINETLNHLIETLQNLRDKLSKQETMKAFEKSYYQQYEDLCRIKTDSVQRTTRKDL